MTNPKALEPESPECSEPTYVMPFNLYRLAVEHSIDGIAIADLQGQLLFANRAWNDMHGYSLDEIVGKNLRIFHTDQQYERDVLPFNEQVLQTGHFQGDVGHKRKDGSTFDTWMTSSLVRDDKGNPLALIGVARDNTEQKQAREKLARARNSLEKMVTERTADLTMANEKLLGEITDRRRAERALRESLRTSADIVNAIPAGLFIYQFEKPDKLILIDANPEALRLTGVNVDEARGKEFNEIWPNAKQSGITDVFMGALHTGRIFETETLQYRDDKLTGIFHVRVFKMPNERLGVAFEDVTERRRSEEKIKESEEKFRSLFELSMDAVFLVDFETGTILDCNHSARSLLGREACDLSTPHLFTIFPEEVADRQGQLIFEHGRQGKPIPEYLEVVRTDGGRVPVSASSSVVEVAGKKLLQVVLRDMEVRRSMEKELERRAGEIELLNDILTHDISNIMQTALANLGLLITEESGELNDEQMTYLKAVKNQINRCTALLDKIKMISLARSEETDKFHKIDLSGVLSSVIHAIEGQFADKDKKANIDYSPQQGQYINTDRLVHQLFHNLFENAIRHNLSDDIALEILVDSAVENGLDFWKITVRDNGPGIKPELHDVIFKRFESTDKRKGTGLGLAIVKALVDKYGGNVKIEIGSPPRASSGCCFVVQLPKA